MPSAPSQTQDEQRLRRKLEREKQARSRAEELLETKTRELYMAKGVVEEQLGKLQELHDKLTASQALLVQSEKMASLGQMAAGIAHEINNPVGFVRSNLSSMLEYLDVLEALFERYGKLGEVIVAGDTVTAQQNANDITSFCEEEDVPFLLEDSRTLIRESLDGTTRVTEIVQGLKRFSHVDAGELDTIDVREAVNDTLHLLENEIKYKADVELDLQEVPTLEGNFGELCQVLTNLVSNAIQAISEEERGTLRLSTWAENDSVAVAVQDTGSGISPENIKKLFEPFFTTKAVGEGTGLGLSISHGLITKRGGSIQVDSTLGEGSCFTVRLPLVAAGEPR